MRKFLTVITTYLLISTIANGQECNCSSSMQTADFIIAGRVEKITPITANKRIVDILVYRSWKGVESPKITVLSHLRSANCDFEFITGNEYLIYGSFSGNQRMMKVSKCSSTQELAKVKVKDIEGLGQPIYISNAVGR